ncbi:MAG: hypothetical protein PW843_09935 [Azospirillaceae bacterium]|nr:hypothetical protein [Azospirillaceae bacterium]
MILDILAALGLLSILAVCVHDWRRVAATGRRNGYLLLGGLSLVAVGVLVADNLVVNGPLHGVRFGAVIIGVLGLVNGLLVLAQIVTGKGWTLRRPRR